MRRIGILLTIAVLALIALAAPASADPNDHASATAHDKASTGNAKGNSRTTANDTSEPSRGAQAQQREPTAQDTQDTTAQDTTAHDTTAQDNSGKGMNRQSGPSEHPGKGWKDPGQDQGSPANVADPDCTGNRTESPQETNIGDCDDPEGAADKPGGSGGFDDDRDFNNGCGNDTDFEDDNNGLCLGPPAQREVAKVPPKAPSRPEVKPKAPSRPEVKPKAPKAPAVAPKAPAVAPKAPAVTPKAPSPPAVAPKAPSPPAVAPKAPSPPAVAPKAPSPPAPIAPEVLGGVVPPPAVTPQPAPIPEVPTVISDVIPPAAAPAGPPAPPAQPLPVTGSPIGDFTTIGLALVGIGMVFLRTRRRLMRW